MFKTGESASSSRGAPAANTGKIQNARCVIAETVADGTKLNASMSALDAISKHMEILLEIYPEKKVVNDMKKHIVYYVKGKKGGKEIKLAAFKAQSVKELKEIASYI